MKPPKMEAHRARTALDRRTDAWRQLPTAARPHRGWIRAIRDALGMSAADLASRIGVTQSTVTRIEASERSGRIQLDTLQRVADALECELMYALVPRRPLEEVVDERARELAVLQLGRLGHTMALEAQNLEADSLRQRLAILTDHIKASPGLWHEERANVSAGAERGMG